MAKHLSVWFEGQHFYTLW